MLLPLHEILSPNEDEGTVLLCPVCGFDYTHPIAAYTRLGHDSFEAGRYDGVENCGASNYRRSALVTVFSCEEGHHFAIVIQQHKGINYVSVEQIEDLEAWTEDGKFAAAIRELEIQRERAKQARAPKQG